MLQKVQDGTGWYSMLQKVQHGAGWCRMVQDSAGWCRMVQDGAVQQRLKHKIIRRKTECSKLTKRIAATFTNTR